MKTNALSMPFIMRLHLRKDLCGKSNRLSMLWKEYLLSKKEKLSKAGVLTVYIRTSGGAAGQRIRLSAVQSLSDRAAFVKKTNNQPDKTVFDISDFDNTKPKNFLLSNIKLNKFNSIVRQYTGKKCFYLPAFLSYTVF